MRFKTQGVCSREISFEVKDNKLTNVQFVGGCSGNTQGLSRLIEGMDVDLSLIHIYLYLAFIRLRLYGMTDQPPQARPVITAS